MDHRNGDRVLTLKTTSDRPEVSPTRPAPLLVHDVLPERDVGARSLTSSLAEWTLTPYDLSGGCTFSVPSLERGDSWVSAGACAAPGLSLLPVVPETEKQGAVGILKP